jgi:hypothetical protein
MIPDIAPPPPAATPGPSPGTGSAPAILPDASLKAPTTLIQQLVEKTTDTTIVAALRERITELQAFLTKLHGTPAAEQTASAGTASLSSLLKEHQGILRDISTLANPKQAELRLFATPDERTEEQAIYLIALAHITEAAAKPIQDGVKNAAEKIALLVVAEKNALIEAIKRDISSATPDAKLYSPEQLVTLRDTFEGTAASISSLRRVMSAGLISLSAPANLETALLNLEGLNRHQEAVSRLSTTSLAEGSLGFLTPKASEAAQLVPADILRAWNGVVRSVELTAPAQETGYRPHRGDDNSKVSLRGLDKTPGEYSSTAVALALEAARKEVSAHVTPELINHAALRALDAGDPSSRIYTPKLAALRDALLEMRAELVPYNQSLYELGHTRDRMQEAEYQALSNLRENPLNALVASMNPRAINRPLNLRDVLIKDDGKVSDVMGLENRLREYDITAIIRDLRRAIESKDVRSFFDRHSGNQHLKLITHNINAVSPELAGHGGRSERGRTNAPNPEDASRQAMEAFSEANETGLSAVAGELETQLQRVAQFVALGTNPRERHDIYLAAEGHRSTIKSLEDSQRDLISISQQADQLAYRERGTNTFRKDLRLAWTAGKLDLVNSSEQGAIAITKGQEAFTKELLACVHAVGAAEKSLQETSGWHFFKKSAAKTTLAEAKKALSSKAKGTEWEEQTEQYLKEGSQVKHQRLIADLSSKQREHEKNIKALDQFVDRLRSFEASAAREPKATIRKLLDDKRIETDALLTAARRDLSQTDARGHTLQVFGQSVITDKLIDLAKGPKKVKVAR